MVGTWEVGPLGDADEGVVLGLVVGDWSLQVVGVTGQPSLLGGRGVVPAGWPGESLREGAPWGGQRIRRKEGRATYLVGLPFYPVSLAGGFRGSVVGDGSL